MRMLTDHQVNPVNDRLEITVLDEPGAGGANHEYEITGFFHRGDVPASTRISFQNGPIADAGVNGITQEALLTIVADRLRSFQAGPYACVENGDALSCVESALEHLHQRTKARMARGVEGTHQV